MEHAEVGQKKNRKIFEIYIPVSSLDMFRVQVSGVENEETENSVVTDPENLAKERQPVWIFSINFIHTAMATPCTQALGSTTNQLTLLNLQAQAHEPKNGVSGATSPVNCFGPRPLDWLKMILRMFQLTETMFL